MLCSPRHFLCLVFGVKKRGVNSSSRMRYDCHTARNQTTGNVKCGIVGIRRGTIGQLSETFHVLLEMWKMIRAMTHAASLLYKSNTRRCGAKRPCHTKHSALVAAVSGATEEALKRKYHTGVVAIYELQCSYRFELGYGTESAVVTFLVLFICHVCVVCGILLPYPTAPHKKLSSCS